MPLAAETLAELSAFDPAGEDFLGVPVRQVDLEGGTREVTELTSLVKGPVDSAVFDAGKGYPTRRMLE
jgi:hypothetical protein